MKRSVATTLLFVTLFSACGPQDPRRCVDPYRDCTNDVLLADRVMHDSDEKFESELEKCLQQYAQCVEEEE